MSGAQGQRGAALVELLIALVVGLVVSLGATQLYIAGKHTFDKSRLLGLKQATVNFAVDSLISDLRSAKKDGIDWRDGALDILFPDATASPFCKPSETLRAKRYSLRPTGGVSPANSYSLSLAVACDAENIDERPSFAMLEGIMADSFAAAPIGAGSTGEWRISFRIGGEDTAVNAASSLIVFRAVNRNEVIARLGEKP
jgi:hypothetical protein